MPDFQNFNITRNGSVNANVPRYTINFTLVHSQTGDIIRTFNTTFPAILAQIDNEEDREELIKMIINFIIDKKIHNRTI